MNRFLLPITLAFSASGLLLVDSAIKGAALLVFASLVVLMLRRDSAATRHLVWMVAIVAMLFVPALSALLPSVWVIGFLPLLVRLFAARLLLWRIESAARLIPLGERLGVSPPCLPALPINQSDALFASIVAAFNAARLQLAVRGRITKTFGDRRHSVTGTLTFIFL